MLGLPRTFFAWVNVGKYMHYYQFNIGDYASHTSRLSPIEDLAYRRLLDLYYLKEHSLNGCSTDVARDIGLVANEKEVEYVLRKFFIQDGDNWTNERVEKEIIIYQSKRKQQSDAGKKSAESRKINKLQKDEDDLTDVQRESNKRSTNHKPITNNQEPYINNNKEGDLILVATWLFPDEQLIKDLKYEHGIDTIFSYECLQEFIDYWSVGDGKGELRTIVNWDLAFKKNVRHEFERRS